MFWRIWKTKGLYIMKGGEPGDEVSGRNDLRHVGMVCKEGVV